MNKFRRLTAFAAAGAAMLLGSSAQAAVVFLDFNLTAVHSISGYGSINPVLGHFELSFDNSADIAMTSAGLLANINIPTPKTIQYAYSASMDVISIGTDPGVASFGQV